MWLLGTMIGIFLAIVIIGVIIDTLVGDSSRIREIEELGEEEWLD